MLNSYSLSILICFLSNLTRTCTKFSALILTTCSLKKKKTIYLYLHWVLCAGAFILMESRASPEQLAWGLVFPEATREGP